MTGRTTRTARGRRPDRRGSARRPDRRGPDRRWSAPWRRERLPAGDAGITLIELVVTMGLMGVFMAMFTGAIIQIYSTVNRTEAIGDSQAQVSRTVARLDKEVRYATEISTPASSGQYAYVEYFTTFTGESRCSQLRLDRNTHQLKLRSWELGTAVPAWNVTPPLVSHANDISFPAPRMVSGFQQVRLRLVSTSGGASAGSTKETDVTFTALNSSSSRTNTSVTTCTAER